MRTMLLEMEEDSQFPQSCKKCKHRIYLEDRRKDTKLGI